MKMKGRKVSYTVLQKVGEVLKHKALIDYVAANLPLVKVALLDYAKDHPDHPLDPESLLGVAWAYTTAKEMKYTKHELIVLLEEIKDHFPYLPPDLQATVVGMLEDIHKALEAERSEQ